ncbi:MULTISPECIES: thiamine pyrophosphate-dependent dehydrogenase E1 component subunit alpha [unclassified Mesorhizobium]|uniref:thiamine pyrophosphate-dependent dehydrogenase E1 component subunit alpha n=1 Tax=unclassified Mesorhizobium TaxID=325217 RepID=UPI0004133BDB|nr:thiamine pyrophosphate-dependent dehydrogenase E1 component subunit alpha [Mesorhizobium sp. LSHC420B00]
MTLSNSNVPIVRREALKNRLEQLTRMVEIRAVEERIQKLFAEGHVRGSTHLASGQEAVSVGIARSIDPDDIVTCTYRGHGHALALGVSPTAVIGEICGRVIGCAGGLGGSMHLVEPEVGLLPTAAIVGAGLPIACGAAMAARARGKDRIAVSIFGDGSANIGAFHESLNFAAIRKLPVVFVCENNLYGEYTRIQLSTPVEDIAIRAASYNMPGVVADGQDVDKVAEAMATAVARARRGGGPTLIEMKTYRYSGHSRSDPATYRPAGELDAWLKRDPIDILAERLAGEKILAPGGLDQLKADISDAVERATMEVLDSPAPDLGEILSHVGAHSAGGDQRWNFWSK